MMEEAEHARNQSDASALPEGVSPESQSVLQPANTLSIDWNDAAKMAVVTGFKLIPQVGSILGALVSILWPSSKEDIWAEIEKQVEELINQKIADYAYKDVKAALDGLYNDMQEYQDALKYSQGKPDVISQNWIAANALFMHDLPKFQLPDYSLLLLPLFAQFANLHLTLLRDGALFGSQWGWSSEYVASIQEKLSSAIKDYQDYTDRIYTKGRQDVVNKAGRKDHDCEPFRSENKYVRGMTEPVLDYRQTWKYFDPRSYPVPVQISFDREIYSDPCGSCDDSGPIWLLSSTPPKESMEQVTVWGWVEIDAIKADYPSGKGPDGKTSTGRMGNSSGGSSDPPAGGVFDTRNYGLKAVRVGYGDVVNALWFSFADEGGWSHMMGGKGGKGHKEYEFRVSGNNYLSRIHINGVSHFYGCADCIVMGSRYIPSTQSQKPAVRRLYVHTVEERSFPDMAAQYASQLEMTPEELIAQASEEGWEQERQKYWQNLREQVQRRKSERSGSGQGPSTSTETR